MDLVTVTAGDSNHRYLRAALVLKTVGWLCIIWGAMISIWIWMGLRAGSEMWLWSTVGLVAFGAICLIVAAALRAKRSEKLVRGELEIRDRAA